MQRKIGWITNPIILLLGFLFLWQATMIPVGAHDAVGPRLVPLSISCAVILLSLLLIYFDLRPHRKLAWENQDVSLAALLLMAGPLILLLAFYGQMMTWFGYLISTLICAFGAFRLFGNSTRTSLVHSIVGGVLFYVVFVRVMGIYDPRGSVLDLSGLFY